MQIFYLFGIESINVQMQTTTIIAAQQKRHDQEKLNWQQLFSFQFITILYLYFNE